jgi:NAD(P)H-hydrate epimerase
MATAGSGDVLSGIIAGLMAQGMKPTEAAVAGVYLHGWAGDEAARHQGQRSLTATDLIHRMSDVINSLENNG